MRSGSTVQARLTLPAAETRDGNGLSEVGTAPHEGPATSTTSDVHTSPALTNACSQHIQHAHGLSWQPRPAQVIWVTAGRLAVDGLALQLKLRRLRRCQERDKGTGTWHAYRVVGGACAVAYNDAAGENIEPQQDAAKTALNF